MSKKDYSVAVVGATGAVGVEILRVLERRDFPVGRMRLLASARSAGKELDYSGVGIEVEELNEKAFDGMDFVFFSAGAGRSREYAPAAVKAGAVVIDNSSAFRMDAAVPLVVPEVNGDDLLDHQGIIANPNCCAAILCVAMWPIHRAAKIRRMVVSTYQSASGAGAKAMEELQEQARAYAAGCELKAEVFPHPILFNVFSHNTAVEANGFNQEENKLMEETRKIFHEPGLKMVTTCIRVPVLRAHSESVWVELERELSANEARSLFEAAPGVKVVDDVAKNHFPMPVEASGELDVLVGRIRQEPENPNGLSLFISGDQLLKGAAWNAVQIAEEMIRRGLVRG